MELQLEGDCNLKGPPDHLEDTINIEHGRVKTSDQFRPITSYQPTRKINMALLIGLFKHCSVNRPLYLKYDFATLLHTMVQSELAPDVAAQMHA